MSSDTAEKTVRFGLIGPGAIAKERLLPALGTLSGVSLWSVLGRNDEKARAVATTFNAGATEPAHTDLKKFLADPELDAVIVASPDKLHAEHCLAAARAGKHVFVEKPIATNHADALAIVEACRAAGVKLAVGYHLRFHQGHRRVAQLIADGRIGKIRHINISWTMLANNSDWRAGAEFGRWWALGALGTHSLDLVRWFMGKDKLTKASALCTNANYGGPHDETALVNLGFESGATAHVLSSVVVRMPRVVEIFGSEGRIKCVDTLGPRGAGQVFLNDTEEPFTVVNPYQAELLDFVTAVRSGNSPTVNGSEGAENIALLEQLQD